MQGVAGRGRRLGAVAGPAGRPTSDSDEEPPRHGCLQDLHPDLIQLLLRGCSPAARLRCRLAGCPALRRACAAAVTRLVSHSARLPAHAFPTFPCATGLRVAGGPSSATVRGGYVVGSAAAARARGQRRALRRAAQLLARLPARLEELELRLSSRQLEVSEGGPGSLVEDLADALLASAPAAAGAGGAAHRLQRLLCHRWLVFSSAAAERLMRGLRGLRSLQLCCSRAQPSSSRPLTAWQPELPPQVGPAAAVKLLPSARACRVLCTAGMYM
jgi:hypothetical protein